MNFISTTDTDISLLRFHTENAGRVIAQAVSSRFPTAKTRVPSQRDLLSMKWTVSASTLVRGSAVGIAIGYGLDDRGVGVRVSIGSSIFTSPYRPGQLWDPHNLLSSGYRG
jgi:hypothetical protein